MIDLTATEEMVADARARSNVLRLAAAQALTGANSAVIFATGSIIGATLAPDISLATVPLSMYVVGLAAGTLSTGAISRAYGRRVAFIIGTGCGVLTGLIATIGLSGITAMHFWATLMVLGVGWNFGVVGAPLRWCWKRICRRNATRFKPSTISWCSGRWRWDRFFPASCSRITAGRRGLSAGAARARGAGACLLCQAAAVPFASGGGISRPGHL